MITRLNGRVRTLFLNLSGKKKVGSRIRMKWRMKEVKERTPHSKYTHEMDENEHTLCCVSSF